MNVRLWSCSWDRWHRTAVGAGWNISRDIGFFMWGNYPANVQNVGGFTQVKSLYDIQWKPQYYEAIQVHESHICGLKFGLFFFQDNLVNIIY